MSILPHILVFFVGLISFLFFFWRRLREDYSSSLIFNGAFTVSAGILVFFSIFAVIANYLPSREFFDSSGFWFWGAALGLFIGVKITQVKFNMRFVETFEAAVISVGGWLFLVYVFDFFVNNRTSSLVFLFSLLLLLVLFIFLEAKYRSFQWYKSGKVGFSGLSVSAIYFLIRDIVVLATGGGASTMGRIDIVISSAMVFLLAFSLYNLAEAD